MARPKLQDVATRAGVSVTTVSRVLNNRGYLSDEVRARVNAAIVELGYRPDGIARSLIGRKSGLVGVIVPTVADPFFGELVAAIENALAERGYKVLLCDCQENPEREAEYLDLLQANRVDGVITSTHNREVRGYDAAELPLVAVDRRIGPRVRAYGYSTPADERRALIETWLAETGADAVFATDDLTALMALEWAHKTGRRVPDDVRIVGYDGSAAVRLGMPGLTTVRQPIARLGARAAELIVDRIADPDAPPAAEPPLPVELRLGWTS